MASGLTPLRKKIPRLGELQWDITQWEQAEEFTGADPTELPPWGLRLQGQACPPPTKPHHKGFHVAPGHWVIWARFDPPLEADEFHFISPSRGALHPLRWKLWGRPPEGGKWTLWHEGSLPPSQTLDSGTEHRFCLPPLRPLVTGDATYRWRARALVRQSG